MTFFAILKNRHVIFDNGMTTRLVKELILNEDNYRLKKLFLNTMENLSLHGGIVGGCTDLRVHRRVFEDVKPLSPLPLVDGISAAVDACAQYILPSITLLNSDSKVNTLFEKSLQEKHFSVIKPSKDDQNYIEIFCDMKKDVPNALAQKVWRITNHLNEQNTHFALLLTDSLSIENLLSPNLKYKIIATPTVQVNRALKIAEEILVGRIPSQTL